MSVPTGVNVAVRLVDVGREHLDLHPATLVEVDRHLVLVVLDRRQEGGHVLGGVVRLEVRRPVGHQAVRRGVRLVEGVVGERDQDVPQRLDRALGVAVRGHAGLERHELGVEDLALLLAHRLAQQVGLAQGVAGDLADDREHVLLVDGQAVGLVEDLGQRLGQLGVDRLDRLATGLAAGVLVVGVHAHRAGPVERAHRADVGELVGAHRAQQGPHRPAVQLEDAEGVAALHQGVRRGVVEGEVLQDDGLAAVAPRCS